MNAMLVPRYAKVHHRAQDSRARTARRAATRPFMFDRVYARYSVLHV